MALKNSLRRMRNNRRAVSPAISMTIMTSAIVVMLLVAISFINIRLNAQLAQNDFDSMKQAMQTLGLQVDDVAWIPGRTQTLTYASNYGGITFRYPALTYNFYFDGTLVANFSVGVIMFSIPISDYSISNNYSEEVFPSSNSFLQNGASAPVCRVFVTEKLPMLDGSYIRIVLVPIVRQLNAVINGVNYARFYLPLLNQGAAAPLAQSVTLTGINIPHQISSNVNRVTITVGFPNGAGTGLTSDFFNFAALSETVTLGSESVVEIFGGNVTVSLGGSA
jgi:hypothetical protein